MGVRKLARRGVFGLDLELGKKINITDIKVSMAEVIAASNGSTVASTGAINEMYSAVSQEISDLESNLNNIIDDSAVNGAEVTWSVDQIMSYIASVDDSVVVSDIAERDNLVGRSSLVAFVLDTTGDTSLGENEGQSASYIYAEGTWKLATLLRSEIDTSLFLKTTDIVNDTTTGGADKPVSAEAVKGLADIVADISGSSDKVIAVESIVIASDTIVLADIARGDIIGGSVEVLGSDGYMIVDATVAADGKTVTLMVDTAGEFDGVNARVSYLKTA